MKACFDWLMDWRASQLTGRLMAWVPPGSRIADVGSGTGHNARSFQRGLGATVDEFDVADLHWIGPGPILFDGQKLRVADASYDVITLLFVLQYVADVLELLRDVGRVSAGRIIVIQSTYRGRWGRLWLSLRGLVWGRVAYRLASIAGVVKGPACSLKRRTLYTRQDLMWLFQEAGLRVIHFEPREWPGMQISRDLFVLEPMPNSSTCPSSSPLETKPAG